MAIGPIEMTGAISRVQDFAQIRQNEEHKGVVDQSNFANIVKGEAEAKTNSVKRGDDPSNYLKKFDAKEKGNGGYYGDGSKKDKDKEKKEDGHVYLKGDHSTFDIRI